MKKQRTVNKILSFALALIICVLAVPFSFSVPAAADSGAITDASGLDNLGLGFNLLGDLPLENLNLGARIFNSDPDISGLNASYITGANTYRTFTYISDMNSYVKSYGSSLSGSIGASAKVKLAQLELKGKIGVEKLSSTGSSEENEVAILRVLRSERKYTMLLNTDRQIRRLWETDGSGKYTVLNEDFVAALTEGDIGLFFETYGTHLITQYDAGGEAYSAYQGSNIKSTNTTSENWDGNVEINVGAKDIAGLNIALEAASKDGDESSSSSTVRSLESNVRGGDEAAFSVDDILGGEAETLNQWMSTISGENCEILIDANLRLLPIWDLLVDAKYTQRRLQLMSYFEQNVSSDYADFYSDYIYTPDESVDYNGYTFITGPVGLSDIRNDLGGKYVLINDIDLGNEEWEPIGTPDAPFTGILAGNGNTISGLYISDAKNTHAGLFGYIGTGGSVRDLTVSGNISIKSEGGGENVSYLGGIAGRNDGVIENCHSFVDVSGSITVQGDSSASDEKSWFDRYAEEIEAAKALAPLDRSEIINNSTPAEGEISEYHVRTGKAIKISGLFTKTRLIIDGGTEPAFIVLDAGTQINSIRSTVARPICIITMDSDPSDDENRNTIGHMYEGSAIDAAPSDVYLTGDATLRIMSYGETDTPYTGLVCNSLTVDCEGEVHLQGSYGKDGAHGNQEKPDKAMDGADYVNNNQNISDFHGKNGVDGTDGQNGIDGGKALYSASGKLTVYNGRLYLNGGDGGNGGNGGHGGDGGNGGNQKVLSIVGYALAGSGGSGGKGGNGGKAGKGGDFSLTSLSEVKVYGGFIIDTVGSFGVGGKGGNGGNGGNAGTADSILNEPLEGCCNGGNGGVGGKGGDAYSPDKVGAAGASGGGGSNSYNNWTGKRSGNYGVGNQTVYGGAHLEPQIYYNDPTVKVLTSSREYRLFSNLYRTWEDANANLLEGDRLVSIGSLEEQVAVELINYRVNGGNFWIGLKRNATGGEGFDVFTRSDGTLMKVTNAEGGAYGTRVNSDGSPVLDINGNPVKLLYTNFAPGEPNYANNNELYVHLTSNGQWNDNAGDILLPYITERVRGSFDPNDNKIFKNAVSAGGIVGYNVGDIVGCSAQGNIKSASYSEKTEASALAGGITGYSDENLGRIREVMAGGKVYAFSEVGASDRFAVAIALEIGFSYNGATITDYVGGSELTEISISNAQLEFINNGHQTASGASPAERISAYLENNRLAIKSASVLDYYTGVDFDLDTVTLTFDGNKKVTVLPSYNFHKAEEGGEVTLVKLSCKVSGKEYTRYLPVRLTPAVPTSIEVDGARRTEFLIGEDFTAEGAVFRLNYSNGSFTYLSARDEGITVTEPDMGLIGEHAVKVAYTDGKAALECSYPITVSAVKSTGIQVTRTPDRISYWVNDALDPKGLRVEKLSSDGSKEEISLSNPSLILDYDFSEAGVTTVYVSYNEWTAEFECVVSPVEVGGIRIDKLPAKTSYIQGEKPDLTGLSLVKVMTDGSTLPLHTTDPELKVIYDFSTLGKKTVTLRYGNFITTFEVTVLSYEDYENTLPTLTVKNRKGSAGKFVYVYVSYENNPGTLGAAFTVSFPEELVLHDVIEGEALSDLFFTSGGSLTSPIKFSFDGVGDPDATSGRLLTLVFKIPDDATLGTVYDVKITAGEKDVVGEGMKPMKVRTLNGKVTVVDYTPGDVDDSGEIDMADIISLRQGIVGGYGVDNNTAASDVNGDGKVNMADVILLRRYFVGGYGVELE